MRKFPPSPSLIHRLSRLIKIFGYAVRTGEAAFRLFLVAGVAHLLRRSPNFRACWLVAERHDEARDNGYHFYRFLRDSRPDVNAFYVIEPSAPDAPRVSALGSLIPPGGWKHHLYYAVCEAAISTHAYGASPEPRAARFLRRLLPKKSIVLLGHGIRKDHFSQYAKRNTRVDLLCCGADPEFQYLRANCGYAEHAIAYTGLARYDALVDQMPSRRQLIIMPTFRRWVHDLSLLPPAMRKAAFRQEPFYREFQALLTSPEFAEILASFDLQAVFYPHYRLHPFLDEFSTSSDRITLAHRTTHGIQELLAASRLLITDYSSVFFDFAFMHKPIIFFQFDEAAYRLNHYKEGYFSYRRDGFGPVVDNVAALIDAVTTVCESDFSVAKNYGARMDQFFSLRDGHNCDRIFRAIGKSLEATNASSAHHLQATGADRTSRLPVGRSHQ